ncbi:MAG: PQQ-binding-like beta-propeller repeat protein [Planctomycetota bacterium]
MHVIWTLALALGGVGSDEIVPWPDFRGPAGDGHAPEACEPPLRWSEDENVRWKTAIHGRGWSSPIVTRGRVWQTTADQEGHRRHVVAVDLKTGDIVFDRLLFEVEEPQFRNELNSYASPSPVANAEHVFVHFGAAGTACLDAKSGDVVWQRRDLPCEHLMGAGSSPVLFEDLLILTFDGADQQYLVALDSKTGETRWRSDRSTSFEKVIPDQRKAYGTPLLLEVGAGPQLVSVGAQAAMGYAPKTGEEIWRVRFNGYSMSSRPIAGDGLVFLNTGFDRPRLMAVRLGGQGDVTETHVKWVEDKGLPAITSKVLVDGRLYFMSDAGVLTCLDAATGERVFRERIGGKICASPLAASGRVYFFDPQGVTTVIAAGEKFELLAKNELEDGCMASPAVVGDAMLLRTKTHLYRLEAPIGAKGGQR